MFLITVDNMKPVSCTNIYMFLVKYTSILTQKVRRVIKYNLDTCLSLFMQYKTAPCRFKNLQLRSRLKESNKPMQVVEYKGL